MNAQLKALPAAVFAVALAIACSDSPTSPDPKPLAGLVQATALDSSGGAIPQPTSPTAPGVFRGTVLAPAEPGSGNDSLSTAARLAGVVVTAYPATGTDTPNPTLGGAAASVTTGADGRFELPALPAAKYVVTFAPPAASAYAGVWVSATAHEQSGIHPWWVTLPRR